MSADYFAHYAYGVPLLAHDTQAVETLLDRFRRDEFDDEVSDYEAYDRFLDDDASRQAAARLAAEYGAPDGSQLIWTGGEDDRPGRCDIDAGRWILGFGVLAFPAAADQIGPAFAARAAWRSWVTVG